MMKAKTLCSVFVVVVMLAMAPLGLSARTLGMVADDTTDFVTVFDADTHAVLGSLTTAFGGGAGDVSISPDLRRGFVANFLNQVLVIDLTTSPPSLAGGTNPIPISNAGTDASISPDGKFLVVSDGSFFDTGLISVIDIAAQAEISTFPSSDTNSVEVCSDGSVLATSFGNNTVRRLTLSGTGTLTDAGEVLSVSDPLNVYCAPGATSGVVVSQTGGITSFTIPGLSAVNTRPLSGGDAVAGMINPAGNRVFARSNNGSGSIDVFSFNSGTGALGATPLLTFSVANASLFLFDQIALHSNGSKLFVTEPGEPRALNVYNPSTGVLLDSITDPAIVEPISVTVVTQADPCAGSPPPGAIVGTNGPNDLNGTRGNDIIFGLGGRDDIDGGGGNDLICGGSGRDDIEGDAGNDTIDSGAGNDKVDGGPGSDTVKGGAGKDRLNAVDFDAGNDTVDGGPGRDRCTADAGDTVINCSP